MGSDHAPIYLRTLFLARSWPRSEEELNATVQWLAGCGLRLDIDLAGLGEVAAVPGAQLLAPEARGFLQDQVEVIGPCW